MLMTFIKAVLGGICIGIGGAAYLSIGNPIVGSLIFSIGLLLICMNGFKLFTGSIGYVRLETRSIINALVILVGNIVGAWFIGLIFYMSRPDMLNHAADICFNKLDEGWRIMPLAFMCNILIFFAVDVFATSNLIRAFALVMCVMAFILSGYEHCIANVFYFSAVQLFDAKVLGYLLLNIIFNAIGGITIHALLEKAYSGFKKRDAR